MDTSENLLCVFSAEVESHNGSYHLDVPAREISLGDIDEGGTYRVALLESRGETDQEDQDGEKQRGSRHDPGPPISKGDRRTVEIEDIGKQGDGIARVERGYVIIVPDTELGDQVTIEIRNVQENLAFGEVIEQESS